MLLSGLLFSVDVIILSCSSGNDEWYIHKGSFFGETQVSSVGVSDTDKLNMMYCDLVHMLFCRFAFSS